MTNSVGGKKTLRLGIAGRHSSEADANVFPQFFSGQEPGLDGVRRFVGHDDKVLSIWSAVVNHAMTRNAVAIYTRGRGRILPRAIGSWSKCGIANQILRGFMPGRGNYLDSTLINQASYSHPAGWRFCRDKSWVKRLATICNCCYSRDIVLKIRSGRRNQSDSFGQS